MTIFPVVFAIGSAASIIYLEREKIFDYMSSRKSQKRLDNLIELGDYSSAREEVNSLESSHFGPISKKTFYKYSLKLTFLEKNLFQEHTNEQILVKRK